MMPVSKGNSISDKDLYYNETINSSFTYKRNRFPGKPGIEPDSFTIMVKRSYKSNVETRGIRITAAGPDNGPVASLAPRGKSTRSCDPVPQHALPYC